MIERCISNPIITKNHIKPSRPDFEVIGVFNPGVIKRNQETMMMLRVAERPLSSSPDRVACPIYQSESREIVIKEFSKNTPGYDFSDPRVIFTPDQNYLTSISHFRLARSEDGINFTIDHQPVMMAGNDYEAFGIEDPRITEIEGKYYISYSSASNLGIVTSFASTTDFLEFQREGITFHPDNKDVVVFPERINGKYYALNRPSYSLYGKPDIWIAESPDLICWGNFRWLAGVRRGYWDDGRIGAGAVPFLTDKGWVEIYHGASIDNRYCLGVILHDKNEPWKIIARSETPLVEPEADYEVNGFFGNVIFSCGCVLEADKVIVYYGAADQSVACLSLDMSDIWKNLNI